MWLDPGVRRLAEDRAGSRGLTLSAYVSSLIERGEADSVVAPAQPVVAAVILQSRVIRTLDAVREDAKSGALRDYSDRLYDMLLARLSEAAADIQATLKACLPAYESLVRDRVKRDDWG